MSPHLLLKSLLPLLYCHKSISCPRPAGMPKIEAWLQGIVKRLVEAACTESAKAGVEWLYVHAAMENTAALSLYTSACGFEEEQKEPESIARLQRRSRRLLFRRHLSLS